MGDTPTTGAVKVTLKLDTEEAKAKVAEVERRLKKNEAERKSTSDGYKRDIGKDRSFAHARPNTPYFRALREEMRKAGGPSANASAGDILWALGGYKLRGKTEPPNPSLLRQGLNKVFDTVNPFHAGGISGDNVGKVAPTLALAAALYSGLEKASKFAGLGLAYAMKSGDASVKTPAGQFFNELNSTFSYINNYAGSYKDASQRLDAWDDAVAAVTGRLPDTQFYFPKFQRQAAFERQFADMVSRNAALTRAGAKGNSSIADQIADAAAQSMNR